MGFRRLSKKWDKKCVISYVENHLKNPVCSESVQPEKESEPESERQSSRADSHRLKRLTRTIREQEPRGAKEKLKRGGEIKLLHGTSVRAFDADRKTKFHFDLDEEGDSRPQTRLAAAEMLLLRPSEETEGKRVRLNTRFRCFRPESSFGGCN